MAAVYAWCVGGGPVPAEIEARGLVDRFGTQAVYGRPMGVREMRRIMLAERIERLVARWNGPGAAEWFNTHPADSALLTRLAEEYKHGSRR